MKIDISSFEENNFEPRIRWFTWWRYEKLGVCSNLCWSVLDFSSSCIRGFEFDAKDAIVVARAASLLTWIVEVRNWRGANISTYSFITATIFLDIKCPVSWSWKSIVLCIQFALLTTLTLSLHSLQKRVRISIFACARSKQSRHLSVMIIDSLKWDHLKF